MHLNLFTLPKKQCKQTKSLSKQDVYIDVLGPLPEANRHHYPVIIIGQFTRWPVVVPLSYVSIETISKSILQELIAFFSCSSMKTRDRGSQFKSMFFNELTKLLGVKHITTTAYNPCVSGLIERFHRQHKAELTANNDSRTWLEHLPLILLSIRNVIKEDLECAASEMVFGHPWHKQSSWIITPSTYNRPHLSYKSFDNEWVIWLSNLQEHKQKTCTHRKTFTTLNMFS